MGAQCSTCGICQKEKGEILNETVNSHNTHTLPNLACDQVPNEQTTRNRDVKIQMVGAINTEEDTAKLRRTIQIQAAMRGYLARKKLKTKQTPSLQQVPFEEMSIIGSKSYQVWKTLEALDERLEDKITPYENGSVYMGHHENGRHGYGIFFKHDTTIYEGYWDCDELYGRGRIVYPNGDYYEGEIMQGERDGLGSFIRYDGGFFKGSWVNGKLDGNCEESWPDGAYYVGEYTLGQKNGKGKFIWSDGSVYEGDFHQNSMHGFGTLVKKDGQKYVGQWQNDMMHGEGEYVWPDGRKYNGQYSENKKQGIGTFEWPSKKKYVGFWYNGLMHGRGLIIYPDGTQEEGEWFQGDLSTRREYMESIVSAKE